MTQAKEKSSLPKRKMILTLLDVLGLLFIAGYIWVGKDVVPFHGDESTYIRMSMDFVYLVRQHNLRLVMYDAQRLNTDEQHQRIAIGSINPLTIGLAWNLAGLKNTDINGFWSWNPDQKDIAAEWEWNVTGGNLPNAELLSIARIPSTLFTMFSVFIVFMVALELTRSHLATWATTLVYASTPSILLNGRRALQEGAMLLFSTLVIYIALRIIFRQRTNKPDTRGSFLWFPLFGIAGGIAIASKPTSILVFVPVLATVFMAPLLKRSSDEPSWWVAFLKWTGLLLSSGFICVAIFIVLMPVWWKFWIIVPLSLAAAFLFQTLIMHKANWEVWPLSVLTGMSILVIIVLLLGNFAYIFQPFKLIVEYRNGLINKQSLSSSALGTLGERISFLGEDLFFAKAQYYEEPVWGTFKVVQDQIRAYEISLLNGRQGGLIWGIILIALVVSGVWAMLHELRNAEIFLIALSLLLPIIILLITNPYPWQRYYLPLQPQFAVLIGLGFRHVMDSINYYFRKPTAPQNSFSDKQ